MTDTIEYRHIIGQADQHPIMHKGMTAKQVQQKLYPDHFLHNYYGEPPKSLSKDHEYLRNYHVRPFSEKEGQKGFIPMKEGKVYSMLTEVER